MFVLIAETCGRPLYYVGKCYFKNKRKKPGVTSILERARKYTSKARAIRAANCMVESTGYLFDVVEA